jgi:hypothetical protein
VKKGIFGATPRRFRARGSSPRRRDYTADTLSKRRLCRLMDSTVSFIGSQTRALRSQPNVLVTFSRRLPGSHRRRCPRRRHRRLAGIASGADPLPLTWLAVTISVCERRQPERSPRRGQQGPKNIHADVHGCTRSDPTVDCDGLFRLAGWPPHSGARATL